MSFGIPVRNGLGLGLLASTMLSTRRSGVSAALTLNFLAGAPLDPRITFSRGTQATLTDSTGKITYAPNNLLTNSESFEASAWNKVAATISANATAAPDGTSTADALVEDGTTGSHYVQQFVSYVAGVSYTLSAYIKAGIRSWVEMDFPSSAFGTAQGGYFNLTGNGSLGNATGTPTNRTITAVGNGWYRVSVTATATATAGGNTLIIAASANGTTSYAGSNGSTALSLWGAQLEQVTYQTAPGTYNSTTPKNLLGFSQEFDNAAWTKSNATVTANAVPAPDGSLTADKAIQNAVTAFATVGQAATIVVGTSYTFTVYGKMAEWRYMALSPNGSPDVAVFDLQNGVVASKAASTVATVTPVGNGWFRCSMTYTEASLTSRTFAVLPNNTGTFSSQTGNGTSGIYIWGAQLSNSASVDAYSYNPGAAPTSAAYYGPRFDYDPVTLAPKGLLIEEQRTNLLTYSEQFNGNWTTSRSSISANTTVSPDGTQTADTIVEDTTATNSHAIYRSATLTAVAHTLSVFVKANGRNWIYLVCTAATNAGAYFNISNGTIGTVSSGYTASIAACGNGWYRCSIAFTATAATWYPNIYLATGDNNTIYTGDGTSGVFVWGAQLEAGAFATSYIPTVASQVTRTADVATMTGANFSNWFNASAGTFAVKSLIGTKSPSSYGIYAVDDGTTNNAFPSFYTAAAQANARAAGSAVFTSTSGALSATPAVFASALAYANADYASSFNGATPTTQASGAVPSGLNRLQIGAYNGQYTNGHIRAIQYYNTRLTNTQLQALTA